ncbi:MAG TPA: hypothetical protein VHE55_13295 [Fimbriimonadaceae bacterium]|nr:hypothetical protein [Fimbriimonadaceae bacterium]
MHGIHDNYLFDGHHWPESLPDRGQAMAADRCGSDPVFADAFDYRREASAGEEKADTRRPAIRKACA